VTPAVTAALRAAAAGIYPDEAGNGLLISHGSFLFRPDFARYLHADVSISDHATFLAWIDWEAVISALHAGELPASGGERRILQIAASIAAGIPVSLREAIPGLDNHNLELAVTAIRHAAGHRPTDQ
jgi:hypothetical protein